MKVIRWMLLCCCTLLLLPIQAQKKITKSFSFEDGVYASHQDFKRNRPSFPLYRIPSFGYNLDGEKNLLFLSQTAMDKLSESEIKSLDNIWGICVKGKPYMKVSPQGKDGAVYFVRYHILGNICYLYYPSIQNKEVEMFVYHPLTGDKVGRKTVVNKERTLIKKLMRFETGELKEYTLENFKTWAKDDERLLKTINNLPDGEANEKLFKTIKIYNDRHPIFETS